MTAQAAPSAAPYAPLDRPGPALEHPREQLRASLGCSGDLATAERPPVLLLSGTTVTPDESFSWNWMPALSEAGFVWCAQTAPGADNMDDIQARGEYIVWAIRRMYRASGERIAIYGHSQGGMVPRWALRFWPDTRKMVSDVVAAAPSNGGTDSALAVCAIRCPAAFWQQRTGSDFNLALNSGRETHARISYTNAYTRYDLVVTPNGSDSGRSALHGPGRITNVALQDVCPANTADHTGAGTNDNIVWELFLDAVSNRGAADPRRLPGDVCATSLMPGIDPATYLTDKAKAAAALATTTLTHPSVAAEPPLKPYVFAEPE